MDEILKLQNRELSGQDEHCILDHSMVELKDNAYITALKDDVLRLMDKYEKLYKRHGSYRWRVSAR